MSAVLPVFPQLFLPPHFLFNTSCSIRYLSSLCITVLFLLCLKRSMTVAPYSLLGVWDIAHENSSLNIQSLDAHMRTNTWHLSFLVRVSSFIIDRERNEHSWTYGHWEGLSEQDFSSSGISTNNWQIGSHKQKGVDTAKDIIIQVKKQITE